eukprot:365-Pyramimonas_sp.AAC.1
MGGQAAAGRAPHGLAAQAHLAWTDPGEPSDFAKKEAREAARGAIEGWRGARGRASHGDERGN